MRRTVMVPRSPDIGSKRTFITSRSPASTAGGACEPSADPDADRARGAFTGASG